VRRYALLLLFLAACATTRPALESSIAPLTAANAADALQQLNARRAALPGARSFMRVRAGKQSFKAQLRVQGERMQLTVYTPLNTTAATLYADGDRVTFLNNVDRTQWQGSASELAGSLGLFASKPSDLALLLLGLPASSGTYDATPAGLAHATIGSINATFDPPSLPAKHIAVEHGAQHLEFQQLEVIATDEPLTAPKIPRDYQQGGVPRV
jgi:outer membrane biogenesis lipoprotein LolB